MSSYKRDLQIIKFFLIFVILFSSAIFFILVEKDTKLTACIENDFSTEDCIKIKQEIKEALVKNNNKE